METLFIPDHGILFPDDASSQSDKALEHRVIVEISDDEDKSDDDGQPESSGQALLLSPTTKRAVTIDSSDDENDFDDFDLESFQIRPFKDMRMKRRKHNYTGNSGLYGAQSYHPDFVDHATSGLQLLANDMDQPFPANAFTEYVDSDTDKDRTPLQPRLILDFSDAGKPCETTSLDHKGKKIEPFAEGNDMMKGKSKPKRTLAPFYDDPKLGVRMYCGPGYERFPVVLGTVAEHSDICDKWILMEAKKKEYRKSRKACRAELARYVDDTSDVSDGDDDDDKSDVPEDIIMEMDLLHKLREVLPDIKREFALDHIHAQVQAYCVGGDEEVRIQPNVADIISRILEVPNYPRQEKVKQTTAPAMDGTGVSVPWRKADLESKTYHRDAVCLLAGHFDHIPTHFIYKTVQEKHSLFEAYLHIKNLDQNYDATPAKERLYRRSIHPRMVLEKKYSMKDASLRNKEQWNNIVNELQAARQQVERNKLLRRQEEEQKALEDANLQEHKARGALVECQCCFDEEIALNRAVSCQNQDVHWFCFACVLGLAESQVGVMKYEMLCMHQSGCKAGLASMGVECAIPSKLYEKLGFYQQQAEIAAAGIEGLEQCPFCDFRAICDPPELTSVFQCQNPDCERVSCRKCHEDSHLPKTCEEVSVDRRLSARHQVEEARSAAMMRTCPKCQVKIIKDIGCNKMRCTKCGCVMCYVCKSDISDRKDGGYGHFNDTGAKCVLYDKDFDRHEAEADEAEREAIKKVQEENTDIDEKQLQIETGSKKPKPLPVKDVLGLGWGQEVMRNAPGRRRQALEAALRQHRERYNEAHHRIWNQNQNEVQGIRPNQDLTWIAEARAQSLLLNQPHKQIPPGSLETTEPLPNRPLLEERQVVAPQHAWNSQHLYQLNQPGWLVQKDGGQVWNVAQPITRPPQPPPPVMPQRAQGGVGDIHGNQFPQNNMFVPATMNPTYQMDNYMKAVAHPLNEHPAIYVPRAQSNVHTTHHPTAVNFHHMIHHQQHNQRPQQASRQQHHAFTTNNALAPHVNFFPNWSLPEVDLGLHDLGQHRHGNPFLGEGHWNDMNSQQGQPETGFFTNVGQQEPTHDNDLPANNSVFL